MSKRNNDTTAGEKVTLTAEGLKKVSGFVLKHAGHDQWCIHIKTGPATVIDKIVILSNTEFRTTSIIELGEECTCRLEASVLEAKIAKNNLREKVEKLNHGSKPEDLGFISREELLLQLETERKRLLETAKADEELSSC